MRPHSPKTTAADHELSEIRAYLESRTGMWFDLSGSFRERIREYMQAKRVASTAELVKALRSSSADYETLLDRLLARDGGFFRYAGMFGALEMLVLPEIHMRKFWDNPRSLRMWSAGCGAGHEAYSVAMTVADALQLSESWVAEIVATDASRNAVQHAQRGVFSPAELESLPAGMRETNFARIGGQYLVKPRIRNLVTFSNGGLVQAAYMGRFDCIFCTDVLTLIQDDKRGALAERLFEMLEPGGYLFLLQSAVTMAGEPLSAGEVAIYHKPNTPTKPRSLYATEV
jgi:chemotaxis methyl-accepting protein methylase